MSFLRSGAADRAGGEIGRPPTVVAGGDSDDEYLSSDDELSENDLRALNAGYNFPRDFTIYPQDHSASNHPHEDERPYPEKYVQDSEASHGSSVPHRDSSLRRRDSQTRSDEHYGPAYRVSHRKSHAYQYPRSQPRPLIDYIKNEWREVSLNPSHSQVYDDRYDPSVCLQMCFAPRMKRVWLVFLAVSFLVFGNWKFWIKPNLSERLGLRDSALQRMGNAEGWFGANLRPEFKELVHLDNLDAALLPQGSDNEDDRRLIFIGDVHGCNDELNAVLTAASYRPKTDHLIFLGDMISKGPNSPAVIDLAISHNASCVRGNHEDRILLTHRDLSTHPRPSKPKEDDPPAPGVPDSASRPPLPADYQKNLDDPSLDHEVEEFSRLDINERVLARQLSDSHVDYLSHCPTILDVGLVPNFGRVHVAHAGLIPHIGLERQDPLSVMEMRTVDLETHVPSSNSKGTPWFKLWNKYQDLLPVSQRATVIYGHDARRGLQLHKHSKGLDTGCVRGGKLTALILDGKKRKQKDLKIVSVQCKDYRKLETELLKQKPVG